MQELTVWVMRLDSHSGDHWIEVFATEPTAKRIQQVLSEYPDYDEGTLDWEIEVVKCRS